MTVQGMTMVVRSAGPAGPLIEPLTVPNPGGLEYSAGGDWSVCGSSQTTRVGRTCVPSPPTIPGYASQPDGWTALASDSLQTKAQGN